MEIQITKPFLPPGTHRGFEVSECVTVPDAVATQWISEGRAVSLEETSQATPTKRKRETASR